MTNILKVKQNLCFGHRTLSSLPFKFLLLLSFVLQAQMSTVNQYLEPADVNLIQESGEKYPESSIASKTNECEETNSLEFTDDEQAVFKKFRTYYDSVTAENESSNVTLLGRTNWIMPKWLNGIFVTSGPSEHETGGYEFNHVFDGLGRFSSFRLEDGQVNFTSKMLKSKFYKACKANHKAVSTVLFAETTPARWSSQVPMMNVVGFLEHGDNNWIAFEQLADKQTYVGTTDTFLKLQIDIDTMEAMDSIKWKDQLLTFTGVSHSQTHSDGSVISVGVTFDLMMQLKLLVFRMSPEDHLRREVITSIPVDKFYFMHAFSLTENYAILSLPPVYYKNMIPGMMSGKQIKDMLHQDVNGTTKMVIINLKDGKYKTIDSQQFLFTAHFSQAYENKDGEIIIELPILDNIQGFLNPFLRENYNKIEKMTKIKSGSRFQRITLNYEKASMQIEDLFSNEYGLIDLPQYNHALNGKAAQYTYFTHLMAGEKFNETYSWPLVKYDGKLGAITARWGPNMTLAQEARFVPNPDAKTEDDGYLLTIAYNFDAFVTSLYVIDAKSMTTVQEYPLPYKLSQGFHSNYFSMDQIKK